MQWSLLDFSTKVCFFSHKISKTQDKEAGINLVFLSRLRNMVQRFMKTYLHRPIKVLQFLTRGEIQKYLTYS